MAASTITDKVTSTVEIEGYIETFLPQVLSLASSGAVEIDNAPAFSASQKGGNIWQAKHRNGATTGDQTPAANTDLTVKAFGSDYVNGVIVRRGDALGNEDLASIAGGEDIASWKMDVARWIANEYALNAEIRLLTHMVPAILGTGGTLAATNLVANAGTPFDYTMVAQANAKMGENSGLLDAIVMNSATFWNAQVNTMLTAQPSYADIAAFRALGASVPVGAIGPLRVFLNDRIATTNTLLTSRGAMYLGVQLANSIETDRLILKAGGTDIVKYVFAYSPMIKGVGSTLTPTVIGGATDAELATVGSWSKRTGYSPKEWPIVLIEHS